MNPLLLFFPAVLALIFCGGLSGQASSEKGGRTLRGAGRSPVVSIVTRPAPSADSRSLRQAAIEAVDGKLVGKVPPTALALFSIYQPPANFVRNPAAWPAGLDLSGVSVWNSANLDSTGGNRGYGTLISKRHVVFANHFYPGEGSELKFLGRDGRLISRTLVATARVLLTDIRIGYLSADVPATVAVYPILPADYVPVIPTAATPSAHVAPILCLNQARQAIVQNWIETPAGVAHRPAADPVRAPFSASIVIGDSGAPMFLILGQRPILLACHFTASNGPSLSENAVAINAVMKSLGGGYELTRASWGR